MTKPGAARHLPFTFLALALALCPLPALGQARAPQNALRALKIPPEATASFRLDGLLTEDFWGGAPILSDLTQQEPAQGVAATESTEVVVVYDDENLFIGIRALDSEPGRIVSRILQRDRIMTRDPFEGLPSFAGDDAIAILLDPFDDNRNGYVFATNPNGAEFDAMLSDEGKEFNVDWRGVWEVAGTRTGEGWSAEFRIPLRTLRYPNDSSAPWGFNVYRIIRRKNETVLWQSWSRDNGGFHRVSQAGALEGIQDLPRTGRNLEVKPYLLGGFRESRDDDGKLSRSGETEVGLDLKTEIRPGLVLDMTFNTDFAQVEVDDERVNLTRFSLFFPEKRDFFLENSGIFDFGVQGNPFEPPTFQMFFSRRIGIEEDEDELVPILGGGRLTGRMGRQTVGFMSVVTEEVKGLVPREVFSVARVKRDVGENNYVGLMLTDRRSSEDENTVVGLDGSFYPTPTLNFQGWAAQTFTGGEGGEDLAYGITGNWNTDQWGVFGRYVVIGPEAEVKSGFVQRTDLRRTDLFLQRTFRPQCLSIRKVEVYAGGNVFTGVDGTMQDWAAGPIVSTEFESGDQFTFFYQEGENRPDEEFELADTLSVPPGAYDGRIGMLMFNTSPARPIVLEGNTSLSNFYGGRRFSAGGSVRVAPTHQISVAVGLNRNRVEIPSGDFNANILSLRGSYSFSTRLYADLLAQYNSLDDYFSTNLRVNFMHRPGSDLFLVFTEERGVDGELWDLADRGMVAKVTYLRRF